MTPHDEMPQGSEENQGDETTRREDGQTIPLIAICMFILLLSAAFAIDVGSWYMRASELQRAADVAALAGARERGGGATSTEIRNRINDVLAANGIDPTSPGYTIAVDLTRPGDVVVSVTDEDLPLYFAGLVLDNVDAERTSVATMGGCIGSCETPFEITPPIGGIDVDADGDGFAPLIVGNEIWTLNHHQNNPAASPLVCVDITAEALCTGYPRSIGFLTADNTRLVHHLETSTIWAVVQRYEAGSNQTQIGFLCHDPEAKADCGFYVAQSWSGDAHPLASWRYYHWGSQPIVHDERIWMMDADARIHCFEPEDRRSCPSYPRTVAGWSSMVANTDMGQASNWPKEPDVELVDDKLYFSYSTQGDGVQLVCWDTDRGRACSGFGSPVRLSVGDWLSAHPIIFPTVNNSNDVNGICIFTDTPHQCVSLDGRSTWSDPALEAALPALRWNTFEYRWERRVYFGGYDENATTCVDLVAKVRCGVIADDHRPYAYTEIEGTECILGLGHVSRLFSFTRDMQPCPGGIGSVEILPCSCVDGSIFWGKASLDPDFIALFDTFVVTVIDPATGGVVMGPLDMVATAGVLDLTDVSTSIPKLLLEFEAELAAGATWDTASGGVFRVTERATLRD